MLIRILLWTELPVEVAMENNHAKIVEILLDEISKDGDTLLHIAARLGNDKLVKYALSIEMLKTKQDSPRFILPRSKDMLMQSSCFWKRGLTPNTTTPCYFRTALSLTINHVCNGHGNPKISGVARDHLAVIKALLRAGTDVNAPWDFDEATALHLALYANILHGKEELRYKIASLLLDAGANVDARTEYVKYTALHLATFYNDNLVRLCFEKIPISMPAIVVG
jgi:ankyrin repeat protein